MYVHRAEGEQVLKQNKKYKMGDNTSFKIKTGETIKIRRMIETDFDNVEKLAASVHFDLGMHNFRMYFRHSPTVWEVACNEKGICFIISPVCTIIKRRNCQLPWCKQNAK
jgi:hypothetical protein